MGRYLGKGSRKPFEEPVVNLTPLIDVVFVILIGFIIIAPLLELDRIELAEAPQNSSYTSVHETSPLYIHVRADQTIWYKNNRLDVEELKKKLKEDRMRYPKVIPQLFHDKKAYFGTYQEIKNALEAAGFDQVDVILKPL